MKFLIKVKIHIIITCDSVGEEKINYRGRSYLHLIISWLFTAFKFQANPSLYLNYIKLT